MRIEFTPAQQAQIAGSWQRAMASTMERRTGPRKLALGTDVVPATLWNPMIPGVAPGPTRDRFVATAADPGPLPKKDEDIAFATIAAQGQWIKSRALTSERLTRIYLERVARFDGKLRSVITLTTETALAQAKRADAEIAAGKYRGPLHGIPFGVKDLMDTQGILTTYGAEPYRNRVPEADSAVVDRLQNAGAVLVAKLSLGALALNDIWFGGQTMNPWLPRGRFGRLERGPRRGHGRGARRLLGRQRDRRLDHRPGGPVRRDGASADLRPGAADRSDGALLVARQARSR